MPTTGTSSAAAAGIQAPTMAPPKRMRTSFQGTRALTQKISDDDLQAHPCDGNTSFTKQLAAGAPAPASHYAHEEEAPAPSALGRTATSTFQVDCNEASRALRSQKTVKNLMSLNKSGHIQAPAETTETEKEAFKRAHDKVKRQIERMGRTTISPQSKFLKYWDVVTLFALLWTAFITPFEVGFLTEGESYLNVLFIANRIVDSVFLTDMVLAFFIPYRNAISKGGMWVFNNAKIAKNYMRSWFALDLLTGIPFDFIISFALGEGGEGTGSMLQMLRVMRIAKLARILRASRIYKRWIDYIGISYAAQALLRFLILTCVLAHWMACLWGFNGQRMSIETDTWHIKLPKTFDAFTAGPAQYSHAFELYGVCL